VLLDISKLSSSHKIPVFPLLVVRAPCELERYTMSSWMMILYIMCVFYVFSCVYTINIPSYGVLEKRGGRSACEHPVGEKMNVSIEIVVFLPC